MASKFEMMRPIQEENSHIGIHMYFKPAKHAVKEQNTRNGFSQHFNQAIRPIKEQSARNGFPLYLKYANLLDDTAHKLTSYNSLFIAVLKGHIQTAKYLLSHGITAKGKNDYGYNVLIAALHIDSKKKRRKVFELLVDNDADILFKDSNHGRSVLLWACILGRPEQVKLLLKEIAGEVNLHDQDKDGHTALHHAVISGNIDVVRLLVDTHRKLGVSVDVKDSLGLTPYLHSKRLGYREIADHLRTVGQASDGHGDLLFRSPREWSQIGKFERRKAVEIQTLEAINEAMIQGKINQIRHLMNGDPSEVMPNGLVSPPNHSKHFSSPKARSRPSRSLPSLSRVSEEPDRAIRPSSANGNEAADAKTFEESVQGRDPSKQGRSKVAFADTNVLSRTMRHGFADSNSSLLVPGHMFEDSDSVLRAPRHKVSDSDSSIRAPRHKVSDSDSSIRAPRHKVSDSDSSLRPPGHEISDSDSSLRAPRHKVSDSDSSIRAPGHEVSDSDSSLRAPRHKVSDSGSSLRAPRHKVSDSGSSLRSPRHKVSDSDSSLRAQGHEVSDSDSSLRAPGHIYISKGAVSNHDLNGISDGVPYGSSAHVIPHLPGPGSTTALALLEMNVREGRHAREFHHSHFDTSKVSEYKHIHGSITTIMDILSQQQSKSFRQSVRYQRPETPKTAKSKDKVSSLAIILGRSKGGHTSKKRAPKPSGSKVSKGMSQKKG